MNTKSYFFFLLWMSFIVASKAQKGELNQSAATDQKSDRVWAISGYAGIHGSSFTTKRKAERELSSAYNFGIDIKREFRPNLFLVLSNRMRFDTYYRSGLFFHYPFGSIEQITNTVFFQTYFINSHSLMVEDVIKVKKVNLFASAGIGINFMNNYDEGVFEKKEIHPDLTYRSMFLQMQFQWNSFWVLNAGADFPLYKRLRVLANLSYSRDITQQYQVGGFSTTKNGNTFVLPVSFPQRAHFWLFTGLLYAF